MILSEVFAGGVAGILQGFKDAVSAFKADPTKVVELEVAVHNAELQATVLLAQAQTKIQEIEAASQDKFTSRARPAIMWICGVSLGYAVIGWSLLNWVFAVAALFSGQALPALPPPDTTLTFDLLLGMLGLGGMRSFDKMQKK